jgi:hypothetical protein
MARASGAPTRQTRQPGALYSLGRWARAVACATGFTHAAAETRSAAALCSPVAAAGEGGSRERESHIVIDTTDPI